MKIAVFSAKGYDKTFLNKINKKYHHELVFLEPHLNEGTVKLAYEFDAVCVFVNDLLNGAVIKELSEHRVKLILLRCAGFNNVDLAAAEQFGITVARVPAYSPNGVAEHALALILSLNRKIHRAHNRVHDGNFSLDGLLGFELYGKTIGLIGTGKIGVIMARISKGIGMNILAHDPYPNAECTSLGVKYTPLDELYTKSDIISLHVPLTPQTYHIINEKAVEKMKKGVMVINTSRGGLVDTPCLIKGLKSGKIGFLGLDVYEEEGDLFFEDYSGHVIQDDVFARLLTFPNVIITAHQAFFTENALANIAETTLQNAAALLKGEIPPENVVKFKREP